MTTAKEIIDIMLEMQNDSQRQILARFFKTGKGEYGEGDKFIGMKVPQTRAVITLIRNHQYDDTLRIATTLLNHPHDLIHKAVGWMLREVGKRDLDTLRAFLSQYHDVMPRTALRYAIERMDAGERAYWMRKG